MQATVQTNQLPWSKEHTILTFKIALIRVSYELLNIVFGMPIFHHIYKTELTFTFGAKINDLSHGQIMNTAALFIQKSCCHFNQLFQYRGTYMHMCL